MCVMCYHFHENLNTPDSEYYVLPTRSSLFKSRLSAFYNTVKSYQNFKMGKSDQCKRAEEIKKGAAKKPGKAKPPPKSGANDRPIIEFPHMLRIIGPKHIKIMLGFLPSALMYSVTSLLLVTYVADWKTVLQYLPYYNGKYYVEKPAQTKPADGENAEKQPDENAEKQEPAENAEDKAGNGENHQAEDAEKSEQKQAN